jgi:hypothetical protein
MVGVIMIGNGLNFKDRGAIVNPKIILQQKRIEAIAAIYQKTGQKIADFTIKTLMGKPKNISLYKPTLLILLSNNDCKACTKRELNIYSEDIKSLRNSVNFVTIIFDETEDYIFKIIKMVNSEKLLYLGTDELKNKVFAENSFPALIYVARNRIVSVFHPVFLDEELSNWYRSLIIAQSKNFED